MIPIYNIDANDTILTEEEIKKSYARYYWGGDKSMSRYLCEAQANKTASYYSKMVAEVNSLIYFINALVPNETSLYDAVANVIMEQEAAINKLINNTGELCNPTEDYKIAEDNMDTDAVIDSLIDKEDKDNRLMDMGGMTDD